ncbi:flagella basal body P-ring formation protein FlgA [Sphingomonas sp. NIBR02145]|uniref:flagella basal body P-ring formation protein FlgA n=1 Tax=Sphingomonas sp. NIBR02145 TaxID=3014784 RepID=UPI0022B31E93|nr:flagella basal body P-ring formation protein FlgA [Sphingomonas sp. NIBR02145]WHU01665.1 flagella basal body P-ring formation protein FlgA [Sphingomonas sp. NIBR02145]
MLLAIAMIAAAPAGAQDFQSTAVLDTVVAQFTGKSVGEQGGAIAPIDARLKLTRCAAPQLEWRSEGHDAVVVRCMAPAWKIFVPVAAVPRPKAAVPAPMPANIVVRPPVAVKAEPVIKRGDSVTVEAGSEGFSISRQGVAVNDAPAGGRMSVKVDDKQPPIQAIAIEPGRARLPGYAEGG